MRKVTQHFGVSYAKKIFFNYFWFYEMLELHCLQIKKNIQLFFFSPVFPEAGKVSVLL
jgi:hypothetical protein